MPETFIVKAKPKKPKNAKPIEVSVKGVESQEAAEAHVEKTSPDLEVIKSK